jgi:hypothetical protein
MKYLCLAYGDEKDWKVLTKREQGALLAQDEALRKEELWDSLRLEDVLPAWMPLESI